MKTLIALITLFAASISSISLSNNETLTIALFALSFAAVILTFVLEKWGKQIKSHLLEHGETYALTLVCAAIVFVSGYALSGVIGGCVGVLCITALVVICFAIAHAIEYIESHKIDWGLVAAIAFVIVLFIASIAKVVITSPAFNL